MSSLLGCVALFSMPASAQDGAKIPPPPHIKKNLKEDNSPDAEFHSPLKRGGFNAEARKNFKRQFPDFPNRDRSEENTSLTTPNYPGGASGFSGNGSAPLERSDANFGGRRSAAGFGMEHPGVNGAVLNGGLQFGPNGMRRAGPMMGGGLMGGRKQLDLTPLNLTQEQKQHIRQIRQGIRGQAKEARQELQRRQLALRSLLFSPDASDSEIRQARRALRDAQDRMDDINLNDLLQVRGVLTREQKQKLPQLAPGRANGSKGEMAGGLAGGDNFPAAHRAAALRRMQMEAAPAE